MGNRSWEFDMWMLNKGWLLSQEKLNSDFWLYWPTAFLNVHNFEKKKNFIPEIPWLPASWFISRIWNFRYKHQLLQCALQVCHNGKFSSHLFVAKLKWNWFRIISAQKSLTLCVTEYWFVFVTWPFSDLIVVGTIYGISLELNLTQINAFHSSTFEPIDNSSTVLYKHTHKSYAWVSLSQK